MFYSFEKVDGVNNTYGALIANRYQPKTNLTYGIENQKGFKISKYDP